MLLNSKKLWMTFSLLVITASLFAGSNSILLKSRTIVTDNNFSLQVHSAPRAEEIFQGYYYKLLQFNEVLTGSQRQQIQNTGIRFAGYIPHQAYYLAIPVGYDLSALIPFNPRTMVTIEATDKMSNQLRYGNINDKGRNKDGSVNFTVVYYNNLSPQTVKQNLIMRGCTILESFDESFQVSVSMNESIWTTIAGCAFVKHIEMLLPSETEDTKGRSLHRSNAINSDYGAGLHYDGTGVTIALADDGEVGPHIDCKGRMINTITGPSGSHGDMTTGICMGAGNLDPVVKGMASGSQIYIYDIGTYPPDTTSDSYPQVVNAAQHYNDYGTVVISTSYSSGVCNDYDAFASMTDRIFEDLPEVCAVWSAGNNQGADCGYGAGGQWGNITGGFKQGKNIIAVANVDAHEVIDNSSSHGPASDGRIKPDITANGKDQLSIAEDNDFQVGGGTSAACPSVAGVAAQCYQAYRMITGEVNPDAALIKGYLLNSAWDIGTAGPDYAFGYGRIDGLRAVEGIEQQRFLMDTMDHGGSHSYTLMVPSSAEQVKIMLIWSDPAGDPNAFMSLVNNLDLVVTDPSQQDFLPWVLDPTPISANLAQPAARKIDTLNNVEQITIDNPQAGSYTLTVSGTAIPFGPQKYFIVYEFWKDDITVTYPMGGEGLVPSETEVIRWNTFGNSGNFTVEYSDDNGSSWNTIGTAGATARQYDWNVPSTVSGECLVKVTRGAESDESDDVFSIIELPDNLEVVWACVDSIKLSWDAVPGATGYEVSKLGAKYMDAEGTSVTNEIVLQNVSASDTNWFSVCALTGGAKGRRMEAVQKLPGLFNCVLAQDMVLNSMVPGEGNFYGCDTGLDSVLITANITNMGINTASNFDLTYTINGGNPVTETYTGSLSTLMTVDFVFATPADLSAGGTYIIEISIDYNGDQYLNNNSMTSTADVALAATAPVMEDFQGVVFPPVYWTTINSNLTDIWEERSGIIGSNGGLTTAALYDNCGYDADNAEDALVTQLYDISAAPAPLLTFDVAYRQWPGFTDALRIDISTDCGLSFVPSGYYKESPQLTTLTPGNGCFTPSQGSHWRNDSLPLFGFAGGNVIIKFVNIGNYGNRLYIDNVNVHDNNVLAVGGTTVPVPQIAVYPNPSAGNFSVDMKDVPGRTLNLKVLDASGRVVRHEQVKNAPTVHAELNLEKEAQGIYYLQISSEEKIYYLLLTKF